MTFEVNVHLMKHLCLYNVGAGVGKPDNGFLSVFLNSVSLNSYQSPGILEHWMYIVPYQLFTLSNIWHVSVCMPHGKFLNHEQQQQQQIMSEQQQPHASWFDATLLRLAQPIFTNSWACLFSLTTLRPVVPLNCIRLFCLKLVLN